ncbi:hypothetical protein [Thalassoroseus pseudoceratinae]|uniref:hypothetical protein n=1 Tax=Thalassoroseus pseudoceratinae TaxID=2713176 RepID=UPI00141F3495|nr:hypothetical protein [Thalassoroseus pseudoceratinae]
MGAFIGYGNRGVWVSNDERDAFLDWYASHRCRWDDVRWRFCKHHSRRWPGNGIELGELIPRGERFTVSDFELQRAAAKHDSAVGKLLRVIVDITHAKWKHLADSSEAVCWRNS